MVEKFIISNTFPSRMTVDCLKEQIFFIDELLNISSHKTPVYGITGLRYRREDLQEELCRRTPATRKESPTPVAKGVSNQDDELAALLDWFEIVRHCNDETCMCGSGDSRCCNGHSFTPELSYRLARWEKIWAHLF